MTQEMIPASLAPYELSLTDIAPFASPIVTCLKTFEDRIRSEKSWRVYKQDIKHFVTWLASQGITSIEGISQEDMYAYHAHLRTYTYGPKDQTYSHNTINRMFTVAGRLLGIMAEKQLIIVNPCKDIDIRKMPVADETTHIALDDDQAKHLLAAIDTSTSKGKRDYAIVSLLLRTGLRRNECVMLDLGDIHQDRGHYVATIRYGKGGKKDEYVKIPPDVWRDIKRYQNSFERVYNGLDAPLFISFRKGDHPSIITNEKTGQRVEARIDVKAIETTVKDLGLAIGITDERPLTPHGLRASAITLWMEHQATLEQAQYAARHKDSRTTQRYRKRKFNLDNNAVDKLSFLARDDEEAQV